MLAGVLAVGDCLLHLLIRDARVQAGARSRRPSKIPIPMPDGVLLLGHRHRDELGGALGPSPLVSAIPRAKMAMLAKRWAVCVEKHLCATLATCLTWVSAQLGSGLASCTRKSRFFLASSLSPKGRPRLPPPSTSVRA